MATIDELIEEHGEETVRKAFWLQEKIYEEGIEGVDFSEAAESRIKQQGPLLVKKAIEDNLTRSV